MNRIKQFKMSPETAYRFAIGEYQIESKEILEAKFPEEIRTFLVLNASETLNKLFGSNWGNQTLSMFAKRYYEIMSSELPVLSKFENSADLICSVVSNSYLQPNTPRLDRRQFKNNWQKINTLTEEETEVFVKSPKWALKYAKFTKKRFSPSIEKRLIERKEFNSHAEKNGRAREYVLEYCTMFNVILDNYNEILLEVGFGNELTPQQTGVSTRASRMAYRSQRRLSEANKSYLKKIQEEKQNCKIFLEKIMEANGISTKDEVAKLMECLL